MGVSASVAVSGRAIRTLALASPDAAGKRDVRIDLLRGFCVFVMIVDHVGGETSEGYVRYYAAALCPTTSSCP